MTAVADVEVKKRLCRDLAYHCAETVTELFPPQSSIKQCCPKPRTKFVAWVVHLLTRTELATTIVLHALHLLRRVALEYQVDSEAFPPLFHERLLLSTFILSTKYHRDDAYTNKTWRVASLNLFSIQDINRSECELLLCLGYTMRIDGEDLLLIIRSEEERWKKARSSSSIQV